MAGHTRGPLEADELYHVRRTVKRIDGCSCYVVAHVLYPPSVKGTVGAEERAANAELFAAAPELANALWEVLAAFHRCGSPEDINPDDFLPDTITSRALAALRKAGRL